MSEQTKKHCLTCGKRLIDEKIPYCYRCRLEGLHTTGVIAGTLAAGVLAVVGNKFIGTLSGGDSDDSDDDSE